MFCKIKENFIYKAPKNMLHFNTFQNATTRIASYLWSESNHTLCDCFVHTKVNNQTTGKYPIQAIYPLFVSIHQNIFRINNSISSEICLFLFFNYFIKQSICNLVFRHNRQLFYFILSNNCYYICVCSKSGTFNF